jgi:Tol biopolymer transport system component
MAVDGSGVTRLTTAPGADTEPAWSPDGSRIAFASQRDGNFEIYVMRSDGSNPARITNHVADDRSPAWSWDGTQIAFVSTREGPARSYVMQVDGTGVVRASGYSSGAQNSPAWRRR